MASRMKPNARRERKEHVKLIKASLKKGIASVTKMAAATGLTRTKIHNILRDDRDLHAEYVIARRTMVDVAADNIADIIEDKDHPQHFQASKYVLQKYKSDLDEHLERDDEQDITADVTIETGEGTGGVTVKFSSKKKPEED